MAKSEKTSEGLVPHLPKALRRLRHEMGLTQKEVARRSAELSERDSSLKRLLPSKVSELERGRACPSFETLVSLLAALSPDGRCYFDQLQRALDEVSGVGLRSADLPGGLWARYVALERRLSTIEVVIERYALSLGGASL